MEKTEFEHLTGEPAYLIWWLYNDCQVRIESIMAIEKNLELIVSRSGIIMAFRYDHPYEMVKLVQDDGKWNLTDEGEKLSSNEKHRLELICGDYLLN